MGYIDKMVEAAGSGYGNLKISLALVVFGAGEL
jgi:hypothetical protein